MEITFHNPGVDYMIEQILAFQEVEIRQHMEKAEG